MRIIRVAYENTSFYARLDQEGVTCLDRSRNLPSPLSLDQVVLLPLCVPTKIICLGINYREHARELDLDIPEEPLIFFKPPSAVVNSGADIVLPPASNRVDYEGELAVVIGRTARNVSVEDAPEHVFGYACANDVTARDLQKKDGLFARAKGFDTFAPIGPWIETEIADPGKLAVKTYVNEELRQEGDTSDMIFPVFESISFISKIMTLMPGDVIMTGTPKGVGPLSPGDEVVVDIEGVGRLSNPVRSPGDAREDGPAKDPGPLQ